MERVLNMYTKQNMPKFFLSPSYTVGPPQRPLRAEAGTKEIDNGGNSDGDPPLPIPNREVKPVSADGTAIPSGRVGSRQPSEDNQKWLSSFFLLSAECYCQVCPQKGRFSYKPGVWSI